MLKRFVVIEAADRMGKSAQAELLTKRFLDEGFSAVCVEPIRNNKLIRCMLKTGAALRWPNVFQSIQFWNRLWFEVFTLEYLIETHDIVICDRWALSMLVYGTCTGCWSWLVKMTSQGLRKSDVTIVLTGAPYGVNRELDSYEKNTALQIDVAATYGLAIEMSKIVGLIEDHSTLREVSTKDRGTYDQVSDRIMEALDDVFYGTREGEEHA